MSRAKDILALFKIRVAALSTLSAVTAFVAAGGRFSVHLLVFAAGVFVLASGSAALNQYQERRFDGLLLRTKDRPLPAGRLPVGAGIALAPACIATGSLILFAAFGPLPTLLGLVTLVLYNGIYTYLKRITAFAAVPGALVGTLPPAMGWTAAGGTLWAPGLVGFMGFLFIWQVPHFWLLLGVHHKDYRESSIPSPVKIFSPDQLGRIIFTWITAACCAGIMLPMFGFFDHNLVTVLLPILAIRLCRHALPLVGINRSAEDPFRRVFLKINMFALFIMVILILDHGVLKWIPSINF